MKVGFGQAEITPRGGKIVIAGQIPVRYTDVVHDPVQAVAMVLEQNGVRSIWVSCDMCHPTKRLTDDAIAMLKDRLPDFREEELILSATHATACFYLTDDEFLRGAFEVDHDQILPLAETRRQVCEGIVSAVLEAVASAGECTMEFAVADILTGYCRRVLYQDGTAAMYGNPYRDDFLRMEYPDGGATQLLYFYSRDTHQLRGVFAAVPCPSQADESSEYITADYWGVVRACIAREWGDDVRVMGVCRAAGELSPRRMLPLDADFGGEKVGRSAALRLGHHIAEAIIRERCRPVKVYDLKDDVLAQITTQLDFPVRAPSEAEIEKARQYFQDPNRLDAQGRAVDWLKQANSSHVIRFAEPYPPFYTARFSVLRIGELLFFTTPAELFTEYAWRIRAHFPGVPVVDVQLTDDTLGYLPTREAVEHGGYSTLIFSTVSTPDGGQMFADEVVRLMKVLQKNA